LARLGSFFRNPFAFLFATKGAEDRVAAYVIREHDRGRALGDILDDPYVVNRLSAQEIARLLARHDVVKAIGDDMAEAYRASVEKTGS
jgi:hypothetical protein